MQFYFDFCIWGSMDLSSMHDTESMQCILKLFTNVNSHSIYAKERLPEFPIGWYGFCHTLPSKRQCWIWKLLPYFSFRIFTVIILKPISIFKLLLYFMVISISSITPRTHEYLWRNSDARNSPKLICQENSTQKKNADVYYVNIFV